MLTRNATYFTPGLPLLADIYRRRLERNGRIGQSRYELGLAFSSQLSLKIRKRSEGNIGITHSASPGYLLPKRK